MSKILITGATGLIGTRLTEMLIERGHTVSHLSRNKNAGDIKTWLWDVSSHYIEAGAFQGVDTIIHLAGASIADKPWTKSRKREILESRTGSTRLLFDQLSSVPHTVNSFISASATGYYGFADEQKTLTENDQPGDDFLADVVTQWEHEVDALGKLGLRVAKVRVGIVLSMEGGALKEIAKPVKWFAGAPLGTGRQYLSWIHIDDLCKIFVAAVEDPSFTGAINGVAPNPVTNSELTKAIARAMGKPLFLPPVPAFALRLLFGEMSDLVLRGSKVSSPKLDKLGFKFTYRTVEEALADLLHKDGE